MTLSWLFIYNIANTEIFILYLSPSLQTCSLSRLLHPLTATIFTQSLRSEILSFPLSYFYLYLFLQQEIYIFIMSNFPKAAITKICTHITIAASNQSPCFCPPTPKFTSHTATLEVLLCVDYETLSSLNSSAPSRVLSKFQTSSLQNIPEVWSWAQLSGLATACSSLPAHSTIALLACFDCFSNLKLDVLWWPLCFLLHRSPVFAQICSGLSLSLPLVLCPNATCDQHGFNVPLSLTKLYMSFFLTIGPWPPFSFFLPLLQKTGSVRFSVPFEV